MLLLLSCKFAGYVLTRKLLALLLIIAFLSSSMVTCRASRAGLVWHLHAFSAANNYRLPHASLVSVAQKASGPHAVWRAAQSTDAADQQEHA